MKDKTATLIVRYNSMFDRETPAYKNCIEAMLIRGIRDFFQEFSGEFEVNSYVEPEPVKPEPPILEFGYRIHKVNGTFGQTNQKHFWSTFNHEMGALRHYLGNVNLSVMQEGTDNYGGFLFRVNTDVYHISRLIEIARIKEQP
jgi:hypothetical protein